MKLRKISITIPEGLLEELRTMAEEQNRSLSNTIATELQKAVGGSRA